MISRTLFSLVALAVLACAPFGRPLTEDERELLRRVGLDDPAVLAVIDDLDRGLTPYYGADERGRPTSTVGVAIGAPDGWAEALMDSLRASLVGHDVGVYHVSRRYGWAQDTLAIVAGADPYAFIGFVGTHGLPQGVSHDSIVSRLRTWDSDFDLDYVGASTEWVRFRFDPAQDEVDRLADEILTLCPDIFYSGPGATPESRESQARLIRLTGRATCWWRDDPP